MTPAEKLAALESWAGAINRSNSCIDSLYAVTGMCDGPFIESIWKLQDLATDMTAQVVGDESEWLDWYRNENGMGAKGMEAGPTGRLRKIVSLADLLWVIEVKA